MTNRDFRLLTARISLTAPMGTKPAAAPKIQRPRVTVRRPVTGKQAR